MNHWKLVSSLCFFIVVICGRANAQNGALLIVDGKFAPKEYVDKINPNDIEDIDLLSGKDAVKIYGDTAKNGVAIISTKKYEVEAFRKMLSTRSKVYEDYIKSDPDGVRTIYVLNGDTIKRTQLGTASMFRQILPGKIQSINLRSINGDRQPNTKVVVTVILEK